MKTNKQTNQPTKKKFPCNPLYFYNDLFMLTGLCLPGMGMEADTNELNNELKPNFVCVKVGIVSMLRLKVTTTSRNLRANLNKS